MAAKTQVSKDCVWCGNPSEDKDHVFPRCLGGTKQLVVPACRDCQTKISYAEIEVARRSEFALYRLDKGPLPRKKKNLSSGSVEATYVLVKDNRLGGYIEVALRAKQHPITLPCIEFDVNTGNARCRGTKPEDVDRLIDAVLRVVSGPPDESGLLGSVDVELLSETESNYATDPDWWPRIFLDLKERLIVRAGNGDEAVQLFAMVLELAQRGAFNDHSQWATGEILAGTPHRVKLQYDGLALARVVAKIACALAYRKALPMRLDSDRLRAINLFVLGKEEKDFDLPVQYISEAGSFTQWPDYHLAKIESYKGNLVGIVILHGACFLVNLGEDPLPEIFSQPVVAMSLKDGTNTFFVTDDLAQSIGEALKEHIEQFGSSETV